MELLAGFNSNAFKVETDRDIVRENIIERYDSVQEFDKVILNIATNTF